MPLVIAATKPFCIPRHTALQPTILLSNVPCCSSPPTYLIRRSACRHGGA